MFPELKKWCGPCFHCPFLQVEPQDVGILHLELLPLINPRHAPGPCAAHPVLGCCAPLLSLPPLPLLLGVCVALMSSRRTPASILLRSLRYPSLYRSASLLSALALLPGRLHTIPCCLSSCYTLGYATTGSCYPSILLFFAVLVHSAPWTRALG